MEKTLDWETILNSGKSFFKNSEFDSAEYYFSKSLEFSDNIEAFFYLGMISNIKSKTDLALYYFYKALEVDPDYGNASNEIGVILLRSGREKDSLYWFRKSLKSRINDAIHIPLFNLAMIYKQWNRPERSLQYLYRALEEKPDFEEAIKMRNSLIASQN